MGLSIGELAASVGINTSAVRYYEHAGLLASPGRKSGRRVYDADAIDELAFVSRARSAGFRVAEIRELVTLLRTGRAPADYCEAAMELARLKVAELDRQIEEAGRLRDQLNAALEADCTGLEECAVISR